MYNLYFININVVSWIFFPMDLSPYFKGCIRGFFCLFFSIDILYFLYSPVDRYVNCSKFFSFVNNASMSILRAAYLLI